MHRDFSRPVFFITPFGVMNYPSNALPIIHMPFLIAAPPPRARVENSVALPIRAPRNHSYAATAPAFQPTQPWAPWDQGISHRNARDQEKQRELYAGTTPAKNSDSTLSLEQRIIRRPIKALSQSPMIEPEKSSTPSPSLPLSNQSSPATVVAESPEHSADAMPEQFQLTITPVKNKDNETTNAVAERPTTPIQKTPESAGQKTTAHHRSAAEKRQYKKEKAAEAKKSSETPAITTATKPTEREISTATTNITEIAAPIKKAMTEITVNGEKIKINGFNNNLDGSYTAAFDGYTVTGSFNKQGILENTDNIKINYKESRKTTHTYEGSVTVIDGQIVPHGSGKITKGDSTITAQFAHGKIEGDATIRNDNREYTGAINEHFSPAQKNITIEASNCTLTGEFDSQLKLWGEGSVVYRNKNEIASTVSGNFQRDQITQGTILLADGHRYEGSIRNNCLADTGQWFFNPDNQPTYDAKFPSAVQLLTCGPHEDGPGIFIWTARIGIFSQPVIIEVPATTQIKPHGSAIIMTQDPEEEYNAEFKEGVLISLESNQGTIYFTPQKENIWLVRRINRSVNEELAYFGKIQRDTLLMHDPQAVYTKSTFIEKDTRVIKGCGFGCFEAGRLTDLTYYRGLPRSPANHLQPNHFAQLSQINYDHNLVEQEELMPNQFFLAYKGRMISEITDHPGKAMKSFAHFIDEKSDYYSRAGNIVARCTTQFIDGIAEDEHAFFEVSDITFEGNIHGGVIQGEGIFTNAQGGILQGNFTAQLRDIPIPLHLLPPAQSRTAQPTVVSSVSAIIINPGATLNGEPVTATVLNQLPAFEAFLPTSQLLPEIKFKFNY